MLTIPLLLGKTPITDEESIPIKPDYHDPNHPHYVSSSPSPSKHCFLPLPPRRCRWPQKRVLIPWILALLFFLTTLWFTSIALGSRVLSQMPLDPTVQEIHVFLNDQDVPRSVSVSASIVTLASSPSSTQTPTPTESRKGNPMRTGVLAPEFEPPPIEKIGDGRGSTISRGKRLVEPRATGFATITTLKLRRA
jgi:hypothetical protein